jgi:hypothetical protein
VTIRSYPNSAFRILSHKALNGYSDESSGDAELVRSVRKRSATGRSLAGPRAQDNRTYNLGVLFVRQPSVGPTTI